MRMQMYLKNKQVKQLVHRTVFQKIQVFESGESEQRVFLSKHLHFYKLTGIIGDLKYMTKRILTVIITIVLIEFSTTSLMLIEN